MQTFEAAGPSAANILLLSLVIAMTGLAVLGWAIYKFRRLTFCRSELQRVSNSLYLAETMGGVGSWVLNVKDQSIQWSDQVFVIHGRDPSFGEPKLEDGINYYHPGDREMVQAMVARAIDRGQSFEFKARLLAEDGTVKAVTSRGLCQLDEAGQVERVYGVFIEQSHVIDVERFDNDNVKFAA